MAIASVMRHPLTNGFTTYGALAVIVYPFINTRITLVVDDELAVDEVTINLDLLSFWRRPRAPFRRPLIGSVNSQVGVLQIVPQGMDVHRHNVFTRQYGVGEHVMLTPPNPRTCKMEMTITGSSAISFALLPR